MSWNEHITCNGYFYPFYDFAMALELQNQYFQMIYPATIQVNLHSSESAQNIKIDDSEQNTILQQKALKNKPYVAGKSVRKAKMLRKREREDNFQKKKQKKDRNIPSNILKLFIYHLYSSSFASTFQNLLQSQKITINPEIFIEKIKGSIKQTQSYIRPSIIQKLCGDQILNKQESLAFRKLIKNFLLLELPMIITPMKKYKKRNKKDILSIGRKIFENLKLKLYQ